MRLFTWGGSVLRDGQVKEGSWLRRDVGILYFVMGGRRSVWLLCDLRTLGVCLEGARAAGSVFSFRPWALCCVSSVSMCAVVRSGRPLVDFRLRVYFGRQATAQVVIPFDCVSVICALWVSLSFVPVRSAVVCVLPPVLVRAKVARR